MKALRRDQDGAASFIVVIFLAIILSVLTIGFVRLSINEQRDSTDDDLTKRAFYAAESGTEDAKRAIRSYLNNPASITLNNEDCIPPDGYSPVLNAGEQGFNTEYTCQLIDLTPDRYEGKFSAANETITIPLNPVDATGNKVDLDRLTIRWHINDDAANNGDGVITAGELPNATNRTLYNVGTWVGNGYPAMLRTNFYSHTSGAISISSATIRNPGAQHVSFLYPNNSGAAPTTGVGTPGGQIVNANCNPGSTGGYTCEQTFNGFATGHEHYLRLTSLYRGASFELIMEDIGGTQVEFKNAQAVIDVTGRAADVYRRVRTIVQIDDSALLPDAITSLDAICKNFSVTNNSDDFSGPQTGPDAGSSCEP